VSEERSNPTGDDGAADARADDGKHPRVAEGPRRVLHGDDGRVRVPDGVGDATKEGDDGRVRVADGVGDAKKEGAVIVLGNRGHRDASDTWARRDADAMDDEPRRDAVLSEWSSRAPLAPVVVSGHPAIDAYDDAISDFEDERDNSGAGAGAGGGGGGSRGDSGGGGGGGGGPPAAPASTPLVSVDTRLEQVLDRLDALKLDRERIRRSWGRVRYADVAPMDPADAGACWSGSAWAWAWAWAWA
jgi:hypothetical protein